MRLKSYLKEKYFKGGNFNAWRKEDYVEIFVNPSLKDFKEAAVSSQGLEKAGLLRGESPHVRFFADDKTKKVYIWNPWTIHDILARHLPDGLRNRWQADDGTVLAGVAKIIGGKITMYSSDAGPGSARRTDWSWADKYIKVSSYVKQN